MIDVSEDTTLMNRKGNRERDSTGGQVLERGAKVKGQRRGNLPCSENWVNDLPLFKRVAIEKTERVRKE